MNPKIKTYTMGGCKCIFIIAAIFSFVVIGKLMSNDVSPQVILTGKKLEVSNIPVADLSERNSYTIELKPEESFSYLFAHIKDGTGDSTYKIITPGEFISKNEFMKKHTANTAFNIISPAYADHNCAPIFVECSGTHYDSQGNYHADGCWCNYN